MINVIWLHKQRRIASITLKGKNNVRKLSSTYIKAHYKAFSIKTAQFWLSEKDQWNSSYNPGRNQVHMAGSL